jgi:hypothetical protein
MDGAGDAAILILRSCGDATECDQEAYEKESSARCVYVVHGSERTEAASRFCEFAMNGA